MKLPIIDKIFSRVSFLDKVLFTKHLSILLKSGIPIIDSLTTLKEQTKSNYFKHVLNVVIAEVNNGQSLEKAFSNFPHTFDSVYLSLVKIGEESGNLEKNLEFLAMQLKKTYEFQKKVQGATLYPAIVLIATLIAGGGLSLFVLPKLVDLFNSLDVKLPLSTKILLFFANLMKNYGIFIVSGSVLLFFGCWSLLNTRLFKPKWHEFLLSLPLAGSLIQNIQLTSFCRNLGIMLKSGLPITEALQTQYEATDNLVYKNYLYHFMKSVDKGKKLSDEMSSGKYSRIPPIVPKMIGVGEKSGNLEDVLLYLGDFFEDEVDDATKNLSSTLEPILLLVIGSLVGFVALAIISPIYQLTGNIHK